MPYDGKGARLMLIQKKAQQRNPLFSLPAKAAVISQTTWSKYSVRRVKRTNITRASASGGSSGEFVFCFPGLLWDLELSILAQSMLKFSGRYGRSMTVTCRVMSRCDADFFLAATILSVEVDILRVNLTR